MSSNSSSYIPAHVSELFHQMEKAKAKTYSSVLGFWDEEVDGDGLEGTPDDEADVCLPSDLLQRHRPGELVEKTAGADCEIGKCHTLGAHLKGQNFDGVKSL